MEDENNRFREDEVDLVDILRVIIKRRRVIIGLLILSVVFSGLYVAFKTKGGQEVNYRASVVIDPPQVYSLQYSNESEYGLKEYSGSAHGLLVPANPSIDRIYKTINNGLNQKSLSGDNSESSYLFSYKIKIEKNPAGTRFFNITLTGPKKECTQAVHYLYTLYNNISRDIRDKNQRIFTLTQSTLESELEQKKKILGRYLPMLNAEDIANIPPESEILGGARILSSEIAAIQRTIELNKMTELTEGGFKMVKAGREISIHENNVQSIGNYLVPAEAKSTTRQFLPVIVSVVLALFVGIFLAFVVEFFSREDVQQRLKEAGKKQP